MQARKLHLVRFGEALRIATDRLNEKNFYAFNPGCECGCAPAVSKR